MVGTIGAPMMTGTRLVVGVTGGIGSGKTTVTNLFAQRGIAIVDADQVARDIVAPGTPVLAKLIEHFGDAVIHDSGTLNRAWLRHTIFTDADAKQWVNALMHPAIRIALLEQLQAAESPYAILSAPLLIENKLTQYCQRVLVVDVSEANQQGRTQSRDQVNAQQVQQIMAAQCSRAERLAVANDVIDNNGEISELEPQVQRLHQQYVKLSEQMV